MPGATPTATFKITAVSRTADSLTLTWESIAGGNYTVRRSATTDGGWQDVGSVTAAGASTTWTDSTPPAGRAFYHIRKN